MAGASVAMTHGKEGMHKQSSNKLSTHKLSSHKLSVMKENDVSQVNIQSKEGGLMERKSSNVRIRPLTAS